MKRQLRILRMKQKDQKNDNQKGKEKNNDLDNKQQSQKQAKGRLSPEQVKSLLDAMNNQEKKVQDKINAKKIKGVPLKSAKDW